jgi:hypothetical protein
MTRPMIPMPSMAVAVALPAARAIACFAVGTSGGLSRIWAKFICMPRGTVGVRATMGDVGSSMGATTGAPAAGGVAAAPPPPPLPARAALAATDARRGSCGRLATPVEMVVVGPGGLILRE